LSSLALLILLLGLGGRERVASRSIRAAAAATAAGRLR
jgi:hypothetical protein